MTIETKAQLPSENNSFNRYQSLIVRLFCSGCGSEDPCSNAVIENYFTLIYRAKWYKPRIYGMLNWKRLYDKNLHAFG